MRYKFLKEKSWHPGLYVGPYGAIKLNAVRVTGQNGEKIKEDIQNVNNGDFGIVWQGTYGYANVYYEKPATNQTIYTLMSISKLFISIAVMQLWEQGKIDLDDDINQYLPYSVRNPYYPDDKITPRHLMTHTSGLAWPKTSDFIRVTFILWGLSKKFM